MKLKHFVLPLTLSLCISSLSGCALLDNLFKQKQPEQKPQVVETTPQKTEPEQTKPASKPRPKPTKPSQLSEKQNENTHSSSTSTTEYCKYDNNEVLSGLAKLANMANSSYTPRMPNSTMVSSVSVAKDVCFNGSKSELVNTIKSSLSRSSRFTMIGSNLESRILGQVNQPSSAYLIRLAKSQNIDYIFVGAVTGNKSNAQAVLKITDVKTGTVVWQRTQKIK